MSPGISQCYDILEQLCSTRESQSLGEPTHNSAGRLRFLHGLRGPAEGILVHRIEGAPVS